MRVGLTFVGVFLLPDVALGAVIRVTPQDVPGYDRIAAAVAGDEVVLAPGRYAYRVVVTNSGTASQPIVIRGEDPDNPPVFDFSAGPISSFPSSNAGSHPERGAFEIEGSHVHVRDVIIRGARTPSGLSTAGVRFCLGVGNRAERVQVEDSEAGIEFGGDEGEATYCRLSRNDSQFNFFSGRATVRFTLATEARGTNFYLGGGDLLLEGNWFDRPVGFAGLIDKCAFRCGGTGTAAVPRSVVVRGNVFVQSPLQPNPTIFLGVLGDGSPSDDGSGTAVPNQVLVLHNTFVGAPSLNGIALAVNATASQGLDLGVFNNVLTGFSSVAVIQTDPPAVLRHEANVAPMGTDVSGLPSSRLVPDVGLGQTFRPLAGSPLLGAAVDETRYGAGLAPRDEYAIDAMRGPGSRVRVAARDVGAFELASQSGGVTDGRRPDGGSGAPDAGLGEDGGAVSGADDGGVPLPPPGPQQLRVGCGAGPGLAAAWLLALWVARRGSALVRRGLRVGRPGAGRRG